MEYCNDTTGITQLIALGEPVIPVVDDLARFTTEAPPILHPFNAVEIGSNQHALSLHRQQCLNG